MYTYDLELFVGTFQDMNFTLHKNDLKEEEKKNIFCYWICGVFFDRLFRECGKVIDRCEARRIKIINQSATLRDQLFMDESGRFINKVSLKVFFLIENFLRITLNFVFQIYKYDIHSFIILFF